MSREKADGVADRITGAEISYTEDAADGGRAAGGAEGRGYGCRGGAMTLGEGARSGLGLRGDGVGWRLGGLFDGNCNWKLLCLRLAGHGLSQEGGENVTILYK